MLRTLLLLPALAFVGGLASFIIGAKAYSTGYQPEPPQMIVIGVDLSGSNPLIRDEAFAMKVGEKMRPLIAKLTPHSKVMLRSFGSYNSSANSALTFDVTIAPKTARPEDMANLIAGVLAGVPRLVREGRLQAQSSTNIVPFLLNVSQIVNCRAMQTHVYLASDGVEDSQVANLRNRTATLPAPQVAPFPGCEELVILGIGRGLNSPGDTERLRGEWAYWAQRAGFRSFQGLNDW